MRFVRTTKRLVSTLSIQTECYFQKPAFMAHYHLGESFKFGTRENLFLNVEYRKTRRNRGNAVTASMGVKD